MKERVREGDMKKERVYEAIVRQSDGDKRNKEREEEERVKDVKNGETE